MSQGQHIENSEVDFHQLLLRAQSGADEAKNQLFEQFQTYLRFVAQKIHRPELSAKGGESDIVQQTMLQASTALEQFQGETPEEFRGWLRQILVRENANFERHHHAKRRNQLQEAALHTPANDSQVLEFNPIDPQLTPCSETMTRERAEQIQKCLEKLDPKMRQVIQLRNWERMSFQEIGVRMELPTSSAAKLWYRALIELQKIYEGGRGKNEG